MVSKKRPNALSIEKAKSQGVLPQGQEEDGAEWWRSGNNST